jgi:hypothetical protein
MKSRSRSRSKERSFLFDNQLNNKKKKYNVKLGYSDAEKALQTIKNVKKFDLSVQRQLINSMLNRAKYNKNQTSGMRNAIKIYNKWMKENK